MKDLSIHGVGRVAAAVSPHRALADAKALVEKRIVLSIPGDNPALFRTMVRDSKDTDYGPGFGSATTTFEQNANGLWFTRTTGATEMMSHGNTSLGTLRSNDAWLILNDDGLDYVLRYGADIPVRGQRLLQVREVFAKTPSVDSPAALKWGPAPELRTAAGEPAVVFNGHVYVQRKDGRISALDFTGAADPLG